MNRVTFGLSVGIISFMASIFTIWPFFGITNHEKVVEQPVKASVIFVITLALSFFVSHLVTKRRRKSSNTTTPISATSKWGIIGGVLFVLVVGGIIIKQLKTLHQTFSPVQLNTPIQMNLKPSFTPTTPDFPHGKGLSFSENYSLGLDFPSFNNFIDNNAANFEDQRLFTKVSNGSYELTDFSSIVDVKEGNIIYVKSIIHNNGNPNKQGTTAINTKFVVQGLTKNSLGNYTTEPFVGAKHIVNVIQADNAQYEAPYVGGTRRITSSFTLKNTTKKKVRAVSHSTPKIGWHMYTPILNFETMFDGGIFIGDRTQPMSGIFLGGANKAVTLFYFLKIQSVEADLAIDKVLYPLKNPKTSTMQIGSIFQYTLTYANKKGIETLVKIEDSYDTTVMGNLTFTQLPQDVTCSETKETVSKITCTKTGELYPGDKEKIVYTVTLLKPVKEYAYAANISSTNDIPDPDLANNTALDHGVTVLD